jgi:stearoyl-CoA desaturase (delta-9 desaturase)
MASIVAAPTPESVIAVPDLPLADVPASTSVHAVPAREEIRMGKAATLGEGVNWLTLGVVAAFHVGALASLFFFSWQRLGVMLVMYVVAINVGIGMCYHRLLTHRGYQVPKWLEYP